MKFGLMLRKTHEKELDRATAIILEKNKTIATTKDELAAANKTNTILQDRNFNLNTKIIETEVKCKELEEANKRLIELFNDANRKNWCNNESSRQLKLLSEDILESDRIDKAKLASYIYSISLYVGGGIPGEIQVVDDAK